MKSEYYQRLNADLGVEFDLFAIEHPEWMAEHIPYGAIVVLQTEDPGFNAWARQIAEHNRRHDDPPHPLILVHIRELRPVLSRIIRAEAELVPTGQ
jgi:hypothetical protein